VRGDRAPAPWWVEAADKRGDRSYKSGEESPLGLYRRPSQRPASTWTSKHGGEVRLGHSRVVAVKEGAVRKGKGGALEGPIGRVGRTGVRSRLSQITTNANRAKKRDAC